jgi:hypothetical protein
MQVKTSPTVERPGTTATVRLADVVRRLGTATAVALALAASDMPRTRHELPLVDAVGYAVQGMARLGVVETQRRSLEVKKIRQQTGAMQGTSLLRRKLLARERELWSGVSRRYQSWFWDVAHRLASISHDSPAVRRGDSLFVVSPGAILPADEAIVCPADGCAGLVGQCLSCAGWHSRDAGCDASTAEPTCGRCAGAGVVDLPAVTLVPRSWIGDTVACSHRIVVRAA